MPFSAKFCAIDAVSACRQMSPEYVSGPNARTTDSTATISTTAPARAPRGSRRRRDSTRTSGTGASSDLSLSST